MQLLSEASLGTSDLARRSGVSYPTAQRAVRGDVNARLNTSSGTRIANALGKTVDEINWTGGGLSNRGATAGPRA